MLRFILLLPFAGFGLFCVKVPTNGSSAGGDKMYLICPMTSHNHLIERLFKFLGGSSFWYVTTLISLLTICIVIVEK